jgi:hypothetical protein
VQPAALLARQLMKAGSGKGRALMLQPRVDETLRPTRGIECLCRAVGNGIKETAFVHAGSVFTFDYLVIALLKQKLP